jgi:hypothetical protein
MPFFDNSGVDLDEERGPIWAAFATLRDQLERFVVLNLAWSIQIVPALAAVMLPEWPGGVRVVLFLYSGVALAVGTGLLYGLVWAAVEREPLSLGLAQDELRRLALPGMRSLAPLYGLIGLALLAATWSSAEQTDTGASLYFVIEVVARLLLLVLLLCSMYWGPLFAHSPHTPAWAIARMSLRLIWQSPGRSLLLFGVVLVAGLIGAVSIGGVFLIVPVVIALLQTHMMRALVRT